MKERCDHRVTNVFWSVFRVRCIVRRVVEARKSGMPCFFMSIPTIVLNDN